MIETIYISMDTPKKNDPIPQEGKRKDSSFDGLIEHSRDPETGAIDGKKMQKEEGRYEHPGPLRHDVETGPCCCGATH